MSVLTYIASDYPLKEVENPHVKQLSVNQALELGIEVPDFLLEPSFNKDKPDVILWVDDDNNLGEISIREFSKADIFDEIYTQKKFLAYLDWDYTESRAENLIQYIRAHLLDADEIELWHIWLGEWFDDATPRIKKHHINIDQLTCLDLERVFSKNSNEFPKCIIVSRSK